jgi:putative transposase
MRFSKSAHATYKLEYHVVWTPRYRRKIFVQGIKQYLEKVLLNLSGIDDDIKVEQVNVQVDHIHMIVVIPPRIAIADVIQFMKSRTGLLLKQKFGTVNQTIKGRGGIWSRGYCVSSIGLNEKAIRNYVENQGEEDAGQLTLEL